MKAKILKLNVEGFGNYLGIQKGCFTLRDKEGNLKLFPLSENQIGEIHITSGNSVSTSLLASCGFWQIPVWILTRNLLPVAVVQSVDYYTHVQTRISQVEAFNSLKGVEIAKTLVLGKLEGQNLMLQKHGFRLHDLGSVKAQIESYRFSNLEKLRVKLNGVEGKASEYYFKCVLGVLPFKVDKRKGWKAYDGINNVFNLAYTILKYRCYLAVLKAHLEPFLGFLHGLAFGKPSLVCDFMELYRYLIDNFVVDFCGSLKVEDFDFRKEWVSSNRLVRRQILNNIKSEEFVRMLNEYLKMKVDVPRIRRGETQTVETLINEEAYLFAKFLRGERSVWKPRIPKI